MTESEINALLDAHDALVTSCVDSTVTFAVFAMAYDGFPHNYALDGHEPVSQEERTILAMFRKRIGFHMRVAGILSRISAEKHAANPLYAEAARLLPEVGLMRLRELLRRYPGFEAEPEYVP
jgi:hypothetical protein